MFRAAARQTAGFSLIELNLVVATIAVLALLSIPAREPANDTQTDYAAVRIASALSYARDLAARRQAPYGVRIGPEGRRVVVFRLDTNEVPPVPVFDVIDPVRRASYSFQLPTGQRARFTWPGADGEAVVAEPVIAGDGRGDCAQLTAVVFDPGGATRCADAAANRLAGVRAEVGSGRYSVAVAVDQFTGRVELL